MTAKKQKRTRSKETGETKNSSQRDVRNGSIQRMVRRRFIANQQSKSGNGAILLGSGESLIDSMRAWYPSYSEWLRCVEQCPECFRLWDGKNLFSGQLQCWLDQWIELGRPETLWPTEADVAQARACKQQKQSHQEES